MFWELISRKSSNNYIEVYETYTSDSFEFSNMVEELAKKFSDKYCRGTIVEFRASACPVFTNRDVPVKVNVVLMLDRFSGSELEKDQMFCLFRSLVDTENGKNLPQKFKDVIHAGNFLE